MTARFRFSSARKEARVILVLALLGASSASAQPAELTATAERTFLGNLALARARTGLCEQAMTLPLGGEMTIGDWATGDIDRHRELRLWARTLPPTGNARVYSDATCDVDVRVAPDELRTRLVEIAAQHASGGDAPLATADIIKASRDWPVTWSTGTAALAEKPDAGPPSGWEDISARGVELARSAATTDAIHALLGQAGELRVTAAHRLRAFLESDERVFEAVYAAVSDASAITVENAPDQVVVARAEIGMTELIRILTDVHQRHYRGDLFHAPDFREMALSAKLSELRATGLAIPPNRYRLHPPYELSALETPPWASNTLIATGRHEPADGEEPDREERAKRARSNGIDELRKQVEALTVQSDVTVAELLGRRPELASDVAVFLSGARVTDEPDVQPDDTLTVSVQLPLERLWKIVRRGMEPAKVEPPEDAATQPAKEVTP